jgi:hypothetical protein
MRRFLAVILVAFVFNTSVGAASLPEKAAGNAKKYLGLREDAGDNKDKAGTITGFLKFLGLPPGLPWCCAFVMYNYHEASDEMKVPFPLPKIGRVSSLWSTCLQNKARYQTYTVNQVRMGLVKVRMGDIVIIRSGGGTAANFDGHTGLALVQLTQNMVRAIEGNTQPSVKGNQRDGGGVYLKERRLDPSNFAIIGFIRVPQPEDFK